MNPRLVALLRQRELLREHATWLDGEIAREQCTATAAPVVAASGGNSAPALVGVSAVTPDLVPEPDIKEIHNDVRQGCLLYFMIAASLLGAVVGFIYWRY